MELTRPGFHHEGILPGCSLNVLQSDVKGWLGGSGRSPDVIYSLPVDADPDAVHTALSRLFQVRALPESEVLLEDADHTASPWHALLEKQYVEYVVLEDSCLEPDAEPTRGVRFTKDGLRSLTAGVRYREVRPFVQFGAILL